uniref:Uncharacterized protein n=1 Tax=Siphoviridae sp. ctMBu2 TaxID=2827853 RepID=A0A8S5T637_9CAUD|nr:MAG TPA: hypothetical protein [Siphoviridae sp. ctMBu2]
MNSKILASTATRPAARGASVRLGRRGYRPTHAKVILYAGIAASEVTVLTMNSQLMYAVMLR